MRSIRGKETTVSVGGTVFSLDASFGYSDFHMLGKGSYGVVVSASCEKLKRKVAIKKITPVAKHVYDAKHVLREIRLMRYLGQHENIISLEDLYLRESQDELYIVMELMDADLHHVIQSKQSLTEAHIKHFLSQLCCGVKYLHDHRVIHRDLKPGNILVSRDCKLRITDFGLARERPIGDNKDDPDVDIDEPMTVHVVTRWYRSPELMLLPDGLYTYAVDVWSIGCILGEMLGRSPLFPGKTFIHQLALIFDVLGAPARQDVQHIVNPEAKQFLLQQAHKRGKPLKDIFPFASAASLDLLAGLLVFNPDKRLTVDDALAHSFLQNCGLQQSRVFPPVSEKCEFSFEDSNVTRYQLKQMIINEVTSLRREHAASAAGKEPQPAIPTTAHTEGKKDRAVSAPSAAPLPPPPAGSQAGLGAAEEDKAIPRYLQGTASHNTRLQQAPAAQLPRRAVSVGKRRTSDGGGAAALGGDSARTAECKAPAAVNPPYEDNLLLVRSPASPQKLSIRPQYPPEDKMLDIQALLERINKQEDRYDRLFTATGNRPADLRDNSRANTEIEHPRRADRAEGKDGDGNSSDDYLRASVRRSKVEEKPERETTPPQSPRKLQPSLYSPSQAVGSPTKKSLIATYTSPKRLSRREAPARMLEDNKDGRDDSSEDRTPEVRRSNPLGRSMRDYYFAKDDANGVTGSPARRGSLSALGSHSSQPCVTYRTMEVTPRRKATLLSGQDEVVCASVGNEEPVEEMQVTPPLQPESTSIPDETTEARGARDASNALHSRVQESRQILQNQSSPCPPQPPEPATQNPHPGLREEEGKKKRAAERKVTKPVSPKFSVMSWQRKQTTALPEPVQAKDMKKRASSTNRLRPTYL